ncbi:glycogen synthase [Salinarimonas chemoclinalis]|uniref:glycogen synthase n=1 Tax=Salinarimonas chemoclinalis TaxID=3241599 RepID=UPI0035565438
MTAATILSRTYPPDVYCGAGVHVTHLAAALAGIAPIELRCFGAQDIEGGDLRVRGTGPLLPPDVDLGSPHGRALDALARCAAMVADPPEGAVVHAHDWYVLPAGLWAKLLWRRPLVATAHSLEPMRPWKADQLGPGPYALSGHMERTALEAADAVVAVSEAARRDVLRHVRIAPERVHVIHNGVDAGVFHPGAGAAIAGDLDGLDPARPFVLFVGRLTEQKGLEHLLAAMRHLPGDVQLAICAGRADTPALRTRYREAAEHLRAERGGVAWIEGRTGAALAPLYARAAVVCCPSVYETFSIVVLEAMACGTPVVAGAVGGNPEQVRSGETGWLVPLALDAAGAAPADPDGFARDLAHALAEALVDPARARGLGAAGRRFVERDCAWPTIARRTADLYATLAARARGSTESFR